MFIEQLRHVKKKWKVPALILIVLLVLGLLSSFAYLGASYGNMGGGTAQAKDVDYYADVAKTAEKAVKKDPEKEDALLAAIAAFDDYATYQILYLDDNGANESYAKMLGYSNDLMSKYYKDKATDEQWSKAYSYNIQGYLALDDVKAARASFKESLTNMTLTSDYLNNYSAALMAKKNYTAIAEDMAAAAEVLKPLAGDSEPTKDPNATTDKSTPETPADVLATAASNVQYAQMMASMESAQGDSANIDTGN
ncbi:MAG: hypothetical protein RSH79_04950 [Clostridiales bacterium]